MKKLYYGYFDTGSTYNRDPIEDTNLARLKKTMQDIAYGNNTGSGCSWWIYDNLDCEKDDYTVAEGYDK